MKGYPLFISRIWNSRAFLSETFVFFLGKNFLTSQQKCSKIPKPSQIWKNYVCCFVNLSTSAFGSASSPIFWLSFRQAAQAVMAAVGRSKLEVDADEQRWWRVRIWLQVLICLRQPWRPVPPVENWVERSVKSKSMLNQEITCIFFPNLAMFWNFVAVNNFLTKNKCLT